MKRLILLNLCLVIFKISCSTACAEICVNTEKTGLGLKKAVEIAIKNNPSIIEALDNEVSAQYSLEAAEALNAPKISTAWSVTQLDQQPYSAGSGTRIPVEDKTNFSWDVTAVQPLFTGFAITSQCGVAKKDLEISTLNIDLARTSIAYQAKHAFISRLLAEKLVKVAEESVESLRTHENDAKKFYSQGMIPYSDVLKAQVGLASATHNLENARSEEETITLNFLAVLNLPQFSENQKQYVLEDLSSLPEKPDWFVYDESAAFESRPEMKILKLQSARLDHQTRLAESSFYPKVYLMGKYEQNGKDAGTTEHEYRNRFNSSIRLQAEWTVFEGGRSLKEKNALIYQKKAVAQKITGLENRIRVDLKESVSRHRVAEANYRTALSALDQARENWRITNLQFSQQMATASDVLDARLFLSRTETDYYRSLYGCHLAMAAYARATGKY